MILATQTSTLSFTKSKITWRRNIEEILARAVVKKPPAFLSSRSEIFGPVHQQLHQYWREADQKLGIVRFLVSSEILKPSHLLLQYNARTKGKRIFLLTVELRYMNPIQVVYL